MSLQPMYVCVLHIHIHIYIYIYTCMTYWIYTITCAESCDHHIAATHVCVRATYTHTHIHICVYDIYKKQERSSLSSSRCHHSRVCILYIYIYTSVHIHSYMTYENKNGVFGVRHMRLVFRTYVFRTRHIAATRVCVFCTYTSIHKYMYTHSRHTKTGVQSLELITLPPPMHACWVHIPIYICIYYIHIYIRCGIIRANHIAAAHAKTAFDLLTWCHCAHMVCIWKEARKREKSPNYYTCKKKSRIVFLYDHLAWCCCAHLVRILKAFTRKCECSPMYCNCAKSQIECTWSRVAKTRTMPWVADHFSQKSH